ncbi:MAG: hypothetical protein ACTSQF_01795 [Candidatus Heimdallarchaeaceae archaeon]
MVTTTKQIAYQDMDRHLDQKIKLLQKELNQLKRAKNARRAKAHSRYPLRQNLSLM